ncbi:hypothetical protein V2W45_431267 [Cenococcum geophilum]
MRTVRHQIQSLRATNQSCHRQCRQSPKLQLKLGASHTMSHLSTLLLYYTTYKKHLAVIHLRFGSSGVYGAILAKPGGCLPICTSFLLWKTQFLLMHLLIEATFSCSQRLFVWLH